MSKTSIKYNDSKRLVFLDPNNKEMINGIPVTPDYADYCVMFRLVADVVNRMNIVGVDGSSNNYESIGITWVSDKNSGNSNKVYFTNGAKIDNSERNYYTTYYTDINYRELSENDVVEGLGVESIDIALENYYAASVKIKFVDVRGSALFAKDEAIHKNTHLTSENIYGCFFTMPYPKFTLQVKGYYGNAMTYQLTCVGFNGSFDSNSGNFSAEASFIGYDFSCLSDLPLRYVILAPCDNEIGRQYWEEHVKNDKTWELIGPEGPEEPQMFVDIYKYIKNAIASNANFDLNSYVEMIGIVDVNNTIEELVKIKEVYLKTFSDFVKEINNKKYSFKIESIEIYGFNEKMENDTFSGETILTVTSKDESFKKEFNTKSLNFIDLFDYIEKYEINHPGEKIEYNKDALVFKEVAEKYLANEGIFVKEYEFNDGGLFKKILSLLSEFDSLSKNSVVIDKSGDSKKIKSMLKFTPYIGNVVKTLLCHVETFIHTVMATSSEIYTQMNYGDRGSKKLGIDIQNTDMTRLSVLGIQKFAETDSQIPPFPLFVVSDYGDDPSTENTFAFERNGWPGDVGEKKIEWAEYSLINGYLEASKRRTSERDEKTEKDETDDVSDLMCASYIFFKNLWDRWLVSSKESDFSVKNMYDKFVFVDSFYRSVEWKLHVNADVLMDCIENKDTKSTVYTMLRELANRHNCMFFSYGDTISFTKSYSKNNIVGEKNIENIFTPVPFKDIKQISSSNKIVFMYHNKPSQTSESGLEKYSDDNMYFSDGENLTEFANKAFANVSNSYVVPSFCVMFGKLSNSIFTNVSVNMEVPTVTNQTIYSIGNIGKMYSASRKKVSFYGQDLFPVYSNFSYICEFEMLGNVQITPLMYFQLFNIPVFRGVYMVFSVKHSMRQGQMITRVKGMRMSKEAIPFSERWFSDGAIETLGKYGIKSGDTKFMEAEEYIVEETCNNYKSLSKNEIITMAIDINGGYHLPAKEVMFRGGSIDASYCCMTMGDYIESVDEDGNVNFWGKINEKERYNGEIINASEVTTYVNDFYNKTYDDLSLSRIDDTFIRVHILTHFLVYGNIDVIYDAVNKASENNFSTTGPNTSISEKLSKEIGKCDKKTLYKKLQMCIKAEYGKIRDEQLKQYLLERVDTITKKLSDKCE